MRLDPEQCYTALRARDRRFDGVFFVAVKTTGIYCRPVCPARTPARARCEFFERAAAAERAGYRACFRCRPELAPGDASVDAVPRLAKVALARIEAGYLNDHSIEDLAGSLGVTDRHLRRTIEATFGVSPVELAQSCRLALAKRLLHDSSLSLVHVAFAAGFGSVRRFNAAFRERFGEPPSAWRRATATRSSDAIEVRLDARPPLQWGLLVEFLRRRAIPGVEAVEGETYRRSVVLGDCRGGLVVHPRPDGRSLSVSLSLSLAPVLMDVLARLRGLFDLDLRPEVVDEHLRRDRLLRPWVDARPGLRLPGAFDGFETAVRAILGQQVSVAGATTLSGRCVTRFGVAVPEAPPGCEWSFPSPAAIVEAGVDAVRSIGLPRRRAETIVDLARAIAEGRIELDGTREPDAVVAELCKIRGIGPWTANYVAMRVLRWPDAFPAGDLVLQRALGVESSAAAIERSQRWQPWRAYAAMHLWSSQGTGRGG